MDMKLLWVFIGLLVVAAQAHAQAPVYADPSAPLESRVSSLLAAMTLDEKIEALGTNPSIPRLGLRLSGHIEGLHGVALGGPGEWGRVRNADGTLSNVPVPTTQFPQAVGLAESWDVELLRRVATIESIEARFAFQSDKYRRGGLVVRAPNADLARDPRWGRTEESYGEDPYLNGALATAFVRGLQGDDPLYWRSAALLKHFMANSNEDGRDRSSSNFDERLMREYYSVPFRMAIVDGGARAYMAAYNGWNGTAMAVNPILKSMTVEEWGEDGIICTDGGAMTQLVTTHAAFPTLVEAAVAAVHAGINQFLDKQQQPIHEALQRQLLSEADIDASLRGVYRVMIHLGLLDPPGRVPYSVIAGDQEPWLTEAHRAAARAAADESIVLLKNQRAMLPLDPHRVKSVAVIGPFADQVLLDWYSGTPPYTVSALEGIRAALGAGVPVKFVRDDNEGEAVRAAREADVAIVVVGNHPTCNAGWNHCPSPSDGKEAIDRKSLQLPDEELIKKVFSANPRTVVALVASFPFAINWTQEHVPAIVQLTHSGQEMGNALADVLFGKFNPAGRTVHTWPKSLAQLPPMLDYDVRHGRTYRYLQSEPLYPFGYGLSFTRFGYSRLQTGSSQLPAEGSMDVSFDLKNRGARDGDEVVQLYVQLPDSKVPRPTEALQAFKRVAVKAGETQTVHLQLEARNLAYWDTAAHRFRVEQGRVNLLVGASSTDIKLRGSVHVPNDAALKPDLRPDKF
jgi:beta-glucosidase